MQRNDEMGSEARPGLNVIVKVGSEADMQQTVRYLLCGVLKPNF